MRNVLEKELHPYVVKPYRIKTCIERYCYTEEMVSASSLKFQRGIVKNLIKVPNLNNVKGV
jgi:hypothetical protein